MIKNNKRPRREEVTIDEILRDLEETEAEGYIPVCISMCRTAMKQTTSKDINNYFKVRFKLANYLVNHMSDPPDACDIEEAIRILKNLERNLPAHAKKKRADCRKFLGFIYQNREQGNKQRNLKEALKWYTLALRGFTKFTDPQNWAVVSVALAEVYENLKASDRQRNLDKAIQLLSNALNVYTIESFPEENSIYSLSMEKLKIKRQEV
ncbi:MAG: hypothetical protein M3Y82_15200 [Verrucomicrobiota bacterium]|nr:hypothetical protein [Verrucomicrobiota bacterium]